MVKYGSKYRCQTLMLLMHEQNTHIILFVFMYVFPVYFRGLIERVEEMRYANFANPEQLREAYQAIRNRLQMPLPQQVPVPRQPQPQAHFIQLGQPQQRAAQPHLIQPRQPRQAVVPPAWPGQRPLKRAAQPLAQPEPHPPEEAVMPPAPPEPRPPQQPPPNEPLQQPNGENDDLPPLYDESEDENDFHAPHIEKNRGLNGAVGRPIHVPNVEGRRPYHALARENAEALNLFLTRDLPVITHQLQETMERLDQLIRRQMENQI